MATSRTFKTTVYTGQGPFVDMKVTQEAQMLAWGQYKGKLRRLLDKAGTMTVNGVKVYKPIDLMGDITTEKNNVYEILDLLGLEDKNKQEIADIQGDVDHMHIDFNGNNMISEDMLEFAFIQVNDALYDATRVTMEHKTKTEDLGYTYTNTPLTFRKIADFVAEHKIKVYDGTKDITSEFPETYLAAIIAGRLIEKDKGLLRTKLEQKNGYWIETFEPILNKTEFMRNYDKMYSVDSDYEKYIFSGTYGLMFLNARSYLWGPVVDPKRFNPPIPPSNGIPIIQNRPSYREWSALQASEFFEYNKANDTRYLKVEGFKKMKITDMMWVSRFFNIYTKQDCGFWCGVFSFLNKMIRALASLVGKILSFGNPTLEKIFTAIASALISHVLMNFLLPGSGALTFGTMDLLSMGVSAVGTFNELNHIDEMNEIARDRNKLNLEKIEDPIEMVKVDGVGDATDWERKYFQMYNMMFDQSALIAASMVSETPEFGRTRK